jgi:hypothetical protein
LPSSPWQSSSQGRASRTAREGQLTHPRFRLHFTPTSASWINFVERWFGKLAEQQICRGVHRSTGEFVTAIMAYLDVTNEHPRPFIWTKPADEIFANITGICLRTSNSGH